MTATRQSAFFGAGAAILAPSAACAHSFGIVYNLPVPVAMYQWGAALALALSFVVLGIFLRVGHTGSEPRRWAIDDAPPVQWGRRFKLKIVPQAISVALLLLCIHIGITGTSNSYNNFSMTWFWIVFVLGFAYLVALIGDVYKTINPWLVVSAVIGRFWHRYRDGFLPWPAWLGYWPALGLYIAFIWIELFGAVRPSDLGHLLLGYSVLNLVMAGLFGIQKWFRYGEFFSVFMRLLGMMGVMGVMGNTERRSTEEATPPTYTAQQSADVNGVYLQLPFAGLLRQEASRISLLIFILFMLSSTAFDGIRETVPWMRFFWIELFPFFEPWVGSNPIHAFTPMRELFRHYQTIALILSPFAYLVVYLFFIVLVKFAGRSALSVRELALRFAYSLLPIALVYHVTHYYTLLQTQGIKIFALASDPWGRNQNLFGTVDWFRGSFIPDAVAVWHTQVGLIVFGHIVSVWIAHAEALRIFPTRRQAVLSQIPMLFLMMAFTAAGLWILSQPISPTK